MKKAAAPKGKTYRQMLLFPELWGGSEYEEIVVKPKRKRKAKVKDPQNSKKK